MGVNELAGAEGSKQISKISISQVRLRFLKVCAWVMTALLIFSLGVGIGDGRINFTSSDNTAQNVNLPRQLDYSTVNAVYQALKANYDGTLTQTQLLNGLKQGLAQATGDPYTEYFTPQQANSFSDELNNSFSGIGAELSTDSQGDIEIISPINGYPASKAGLEPKDILTEINGKTTTGMSVDQAADAIRGAAGTVVNLQVLRNQSQILSFNIKRENITIPSVSYKVINGDIGYMQISTFADDTAGLAAKAANQFTADKVKGVILDVRDDPGGLLNAAISVSSLWLPQGQLILQEKEGNTVTATYKASGDDVLHGLPTVVLINSGSASASEITAGALHDNGDAELIGQQSFGKGSVQQLINFPDGSELKVTIAHWYRPDGMNINKIGIKPDQTVDLSASDISSGNDTQLNAAISWIQAR